MYYDPSTTSYFYYDEVEQTYKFHSYSSEQYSEQPAQSWDQGDGERTATQEGAEATQKIEAKHSSSREKRHRKHKHREQAKVQVELNMICVAITLSFDPPLLVLLS